MKRILPVILALTVLLCACGEPVATVPSVPETTVPIQPATEPSTVPTAPATEPATEPTEPVTEPTTMPTEAPVIYRNPLNGTPLDAPYEGRVFAVTVNNVKPALPHHGVSQADLFFEMFIDNYCTRGLAMFSNVAEVESIGSIRSVRYNFTDLCQAYEAVLVHASGSDEVMADLRASGVNHMNADSSIGYRDKDRYKNRGYAWEHTLFAEGDDLVEAAQKKGFALALEDRDYGMLFAEDGTPVDGAAASEIEIVFSLNKRTKSTTMKYNPDTGRYVFWQYGKEMKDEEYNRPESFENVIILLTKVENKGVYHIAELTGRGDGWYACNGKIVPITWIHENEEEPIRFFLTDGMPLYQGVGSTYIAVAPTNSPVNYQ